MSGPLRIGCLGAARITPMALIRPARAVPEVTVTALAARDRDRATEFARKWEIPRVHGSYEALVTDPDVDAVYNPLPNALHGRWSLRALEAGKHVLCEKPMAANAEEAERMAGAAQQSGRLLVEAFHWRYHPLAERLREIVASGEIGALRHVEAHLCFPLLLPGDIRYRGDLAGGATMDAGCYTVHIVRTLAGEEPEVVRAEARLSSPGVDRCMEADLCFPDGVTGRVVCSLFSRTLLRLRAEAVGETGRVRVFNPIAPQYYHRISVRGRRGRRRERVSGEATYTHQLRAFARAVGGGTPPLTPPEDAVANMRVIDAIYRAAGLEPRRPA